ncbi:MAG TPA: SDR family NAD(P)-dependent oxidoreductase [Candidatus Polarisedimenticolia bacterium]|nr:SDR family NAD(P)-dependent oxidoreductase [Candidatus Polarisedimenticolia bacterium]
MQQGNDLQQKRVVVVGGSSGIGLAVAQQAASQGAKVVTVSTSRCSAGDIRCRILHLKPRGLLI